MQGSIADRSAAESYARWLSEYRFVVRRLRVARRSRHTIDEPRAGLERVMSKMERRCLGRVGAAERKQQGKGLTGTGQGPMRRRPDLDQFKVNRWVVRVSR